jgi:hypothetical protein
MFVVLFGVCTGTVPAQAGNFFTEVKEFLFGKPACIVGLVGGTNKMSMCVFADKARRTPRQLWFDKAGSIHILKREGAGPFVYGLAQFTDGSGKTTSLDAKLSSSANWFKVVKPAAPNEDLDSWLRRQATQQTIQQGGRIRYLDFEAFVSYETVNGCISGPCFVAFDVSKLAGGFAYTLTLRTIVTQGKNVLPPALTEFTFFVESEDTAIGRYIKQLEDCPESNSGYTPGDSTLGDTGETLDNAPPTSHDGRVEFELLDDAREIALNEQARISLQALADEIGYRGPLGRRAAFRLKPEARTGNAQAIMFFVRDGQLTKQGESLRVVGSSGWSKEVTVPAEGYAYFRNIAMSAGNLTFTCTSSKLTTENTDVPSAAFWLPMGR